MNVSEQIKNAYKNNTHAKILEILFPNIDYTVPIDEVYYESMTLDESIFDEDSFEAVGCIASQFSISIRDSGLNLKDELVTVSISLDGIENSAIPLFYGYIDSVEREAQKKMQKIVAYDPLYSLGSKDVRNWYETLNYPITLKNFRDSLFEEIGITQATAGLPCDDIRINKEFNPKELIASSVIKALCQINGCFGIMNRNGVFEYRYLNTSGTAEDVSYYRSMNYGDYTIRPVGKLTIRQSAKDTGMSIGGGDNVYVIQGNMFTYNLAIDTIYNIATSLYPLLYTIEYTPFDAFNNGYPWIEMGDNCSLAYSVYDFDNSTSSTEVYKTVTVVAMKRSLKGIQNLIDTYKAGGDEFQHEFISDLSIELDVLQQTVDEIQKNMSTEISIYRNTAPIAVIDGTTVTIADMVYEANEGNTVIFHEELDIESRAESNIDATVRYYVNGYRLPTHTSEGQLLPGKNILTFIQFWEAGEISPSRVQAKITLNGGSANIAKFRANAYITVKQSGYKEASIEVTTEPDKIIYRPGETLDFTGLVISKVYHDESIPSEDVTALCRFTPSEGYTVPSTDMITVKVTYEETTEVGDLKIYTTEFYLSTQYLLSISVEQEPDKDTYTVGESLDLTGIRVVADYIDGSVVDVTSDCTFSPDTGYTFTSTEEGEIEISYTEDGITATTSTTVSVKEVPVPPAPTPIFDLKYFNYDRDTENQVIKINSIRASQVEADSVTDLIIPATITDEDSGIVYTVVIDAGTS